MANFYIIVSKGLTKKQVQKLGIQQYAFRGKMFHTRNEAEEYFEKLPYVYQRRQKILALD